MKNKILALLALLLVSNLATAQMPRNAVEASQNQKAIAANEAQLERDLVELAAFKVKMREFEHALASKNPRKVAAIKTELVNAMEREINQSERKIAQDRQELAQSQSEVAASNRELRRSRIDRATIDNDAKDGRDVRDDRRDKRDDQRDAMDDRNDLEQQVLRTKRQKEIYNNIEAFTFSYTPNLQQKVRANRALLDEFLSTMERDIAATKVEIAEDKREAVEDRRERREDKRERAEKRRNRNW
ncbi:MAG: hypothetical protein AAGG75_15160 [Bacteroidota bacterium]